MKDDRLDRIHQFTEVSYNYKRKLLNFHNSLVNKSSQYYQFKRLHIHTRYHVSILASLKPCAHIITTVQPATPAPYYRHFSEL